MKRKKVALYDPYLNTLGGGERHILSIIKVLNEREFDIDIFWHQDLSEQIETKLNIIFNPYARFKNNWQTLSTMNRFQELSQYEIFFYVTDGSYFFSGAKKNYIFCMVPQKNLYSMSPINRLKTLNSTFISNSKFTQNWLQQWGVQSTLLYPFIDQEYIDLSVTTPKKKIILSTGRFFKQLHAKRQDVAIDWFKKLKDKNAQFQDYTLILAGSVETNDKEYFQELQKMARGRTDIIFKVNIQFEELKNLYTTAEWYWHFAGYDVDVNTHPEAVEHLGITPLEAMASGCLTCAYAAGGPTETIQHENTGILFKTSDELMESMKSLAGDTTKKELMKKKAKEYVHKNFSYDVFKKNTIEEILCNYR